MSQNPSILCLFLLSLIIPQAQTLNGHRFLTQRTQNSHRSLQQPVSYTFPNLLNYQVPIQVQPCSYFNDMNGQFAEAMLEVFNMQVALDNVPQQIEGTFEEMKDNFTDYNSKSKNDQLGPKILNDTQSVIDAATNMVTLSQKNAYLDNLQAGQDLVNKYLDNLACTFTANVKASSDNYLCVANDASINLMATPLPLNKCEQFQFIFTGSFNTVNGTRSYCIMSLYNGNFLTVDDNLRVFANGIVCESM